MFAVPNTRAQRFSSRRKICEFELGPRFLAPAAASQLEASIKAADLLAPLLYGVEFVAEGGWHRGFA